MKFGHLVLIIGATLRCALVHADPHVQTSAPATKATGIADPRSGPLLPLYERGKESQLGDALLIFATYDAKPPNTLIGIDGSFTDDQIVSALKRFYREWRPPADAPSTSRPKLILAGQNWGSGASLLAPLRAISAEFEIDVYTLNPVLTFFHRQPWHPTRNDKRLGEILNGN